MYHLMIIDQGAIGDFFNSQVHIGLAEKYGLGKFKFSFIQRGQFLNREVFQKEAKKNNGRVIIVRRNGFSRETNSFAEELYSLLLDCGYPPCKIEMVFWQKMEKVTSIFCSKANAPIEKWERI